MTRAPDGVARRRTNPQMSLSALDALFSGPLAPYRDRIVATSDPRPGLSGSALLDPPVLSERLHRFASNYDRPEPRAVASIWSKHHFSNLLVPTLAASLVLNRSLPVRLDAIEVIAGEDGRSAAFKLRDAGAPAEASTRFTELIEGHLRPFVDRLAAASGLSPRVLWGNAGLVFDSVARQVDGLPLADRGGLEAVWALLASPRLADGGANPLFAPVRMAGPPETPVRRRRVCCLRYLIPAQSLCATCPITARPA